MNDGSPPSDDVHAAEHIRGVIDGIDVRESKKKLQALRGSAVEPILEAVAGHHGNLHLRSDETLDHLTVVLEKLAEEDAGPIAAALTHDTPSLNLAVWALGHSDTQQARTLIDSFVEHEDPGIQAVARYHIARRKGEASAPLDAGERTAARRSDSSTQSD